jgi:hypothetical protein
MQVVEQVQVETVKIQVEQEEAEIQIQLKLQVLQVVQVQQILEEAVELLVQQVEVRAVQESWSLERQEVKELH